MKACRLKIITANILNENDTPQIHYISQNKKQKKLNIINNNDINNKDLNHYLEENNKIEKEIIEKITENKSPEEILNNDNKNYQDINNENIENNENENGRNDNIFEQKVDINDLYTISNKNLCEEQKINNIYSVLDSNYNPYTHLNNNYPYAIINKKKGLNNSLRHLFKNRETKLITNKSSNLSLNKSLSNSKITNLNNKIIKVKNSNNSKLNLNQSINKSFGLKNSKSSENISFKNKKNKSNNNLNKTKKNYILRAKQNNSNKKNEENAGSKVSSWLIIEKNDNNIGQSIDYKTLIDDLIVKECQLVKEKENFIQIFEQKLKPLRELNKKLMEDNNEELNREDELNGELILLRNHYEKLFNSLNLNEKNKENKNNIKDIDFDKKQKEIDAEFAILNNQIKNCELILITKPGNYHRLTEEKDKNITLLLKATFYSIHIVDTDIIVDKIWKFDKQFQTIYFIVEELVKFFNLNYKYDGNILINYFYSFLKQYSYLNITKFKEEFKKKIGKFQFLNKYIYISKLMHFHKTKINTLIKSIIKRDIFGRGVINFNKFINLLIDCNIFPRFPTIRDKDSMEMIEFLTFCMKKSRKLELFEEKEFLEMNDKDKKGSLFDLYYESLQDFIDEYNSNPISNPYALIRNYMNNNDIISAEKLLRPIINEKNILKINSVDYIDIIVLNKFLRFKGIIKNKDCIILKTFEEELIDINKFINDIYTNENEEENKENFEDITHKANDLIDEILKLNY